MFPFHFNQLKSCLGINFIQSQIKEQNSMIGLPFVLPEPVPDPRSAFPCSGGESQAMARLKHYFWDTVSTCSFTHIWRWDHLLCVVSDKCVFPVTQDAVATYKETRNGLIGVDYSTKFSPWWVIVLVCEQALIFNLSKSYRDVSAGVTLQVGPGLHFTQVHLSSDQAIWERANSQSEHILVSLESGSSTRRGPAVRVQPQFVFFSKSSGSFLNCCGGITSSLWPSSTETSCFTSKVTFAPHVWDTRNDCQNKRPSDSGLQDKSVSWKKDMKLFNAWKGEAFSLLPPLCSWNIFF